MIVTVRFLGLLADWAGISQAAIPLPPESCFVDLLAEIGRRWAHNMPAQMWDSERQVFIKPVTAAAEPGGALAPQTPLSDGQTITVFLSAAGG